MNFTVLYLDDSIIMVETDSGLKQSSEIILYLLL